MKKIAISLFIGLAIFLTYKKFNKKKTTAKTLYLATSSPVNTLDPSATFSLGDFQEISKVYETLLTYDYLKRPAKIIPELAESLPEISEDGLTYTFKIKKKIFFQDNKCFKDGKGRELTAEDFVFAIKRASDPKINCPFFSFLSGKILGIDEWRSKNISRKKTDYEEDIEGVCVIDKYTLKIKLKNFFPHLSMIFCLPFISAIPKEAVEYYGEKFPLNPVGTGPFIIKDYKVSDSKIVAVKNPNFREKFYPKEVSSDLKDSDLLKDAGKKLPLIDQIVTYIIPEGSSMWLKFLKKDIDIINVQSLTNIKEKITEYKNKGFYDNYKENPSSTLSLLVFNTNTYPFKNNKYLRQAISCAIDKTKLNDLLYDSTKIVSKGVIPPEISGYNADCLYGYQDFDLKKSKSLLVKAGYKNGEGLEEVEFLTYKNNDTLAEFLQRSLKEIGVNLKIKVVMPSEFEHLVTTGAYQMAATGFIFAYPDADNILNLFYKGNSLSFGCYNSDIYNKVYEKIINSSDMKYRVEIYKELNEILMEEVPVVPLFYYNNMHMVYPWIKNFAYSDITFLTYFQYLNIDVDKKLICKKL